MLLHAYLPKLITALFGGLFIAAGVLTFGNALVFDRLYIGILIFTAIVCRKDINVVGIIVILSLERFFEEGVWFAIIEKNLWVAPDISVHINLIIYPLLAFLFYKLRYDSITKFAIFCLSISIAAECYWWFTAYENAPSIYWYNLLIAQNLLIRFGIFSRVDFTQWLFKKDAQSINLDWSIYQITRLYIFIDILSVLESLIRHIIPLPKLLIIYNSFPYASHAFATGILWVVFNEVNKLLSTRLLKA